MTECFHCGLPVPKGVEILVPINGAERAMCCHGCEAVARTIVDAGLADFYDRRSAKPLARAETVPEFLSAASAYDNPAIQGKYVEDRDGAARHVSLIVDGINCAACAWLIERRLKETPGITDAYVNYSTHRAALSWNPDRIRLSEILRRIGAIGYRAQPYDPTVHEDLARRETKAFLLRMGITGALGMQVMMIATAMYFGDSGGIDQGYRGLFRWLSLFLTIPIIVYCALPFFHGALRDLGNRSLGMDVPVSLGLGVAFLGSVWNTWTGTGSVYYDSVAMFVFLLLCARFLETRARHRSIATIEGLTLSTPDLAERRDRSGQWCAVSASELSPGDVVRVRPGNGFPADGIILEGATSANESLLTGESTPVAKDTGSEVLAGSVNVDQPVVVEVSRARSGSIISQIVRLTEKAQSYKPRLALAADRAASWFIGGVLVLAVAAGIYWFIRGDADWLAVVVSILVVTCPCALSLATPAALTSAVNALTGQSVVPVSSDALESLARVDTLMMDKTGTLTEGKLSIKDIDCFGDMARDRVLGIAAALNHSSRHPVARAICRCWPGPVPALSAPQHGVGGVNGVVDGTRYYIGNAEYVGAHTRTRPSFDGTNTCSWLADDERLLARIELEDRLRVEARPMLEAIRRRGIDVYLCSGDHAAAVKEIARQLGIRRWSGDMTPSRKLEMLRTLQHQGRRVAAVGDGTNDAPFLSAADVSISMAGGADLARVNADMVLMSDTLLAIPKAIRIAHRTRRIIHQNIAWAVGYNLIAVPAAAAGAVPPWLAAIGMSLSSLIVVTNALRLNVERRKGRDGQVQPALAAAAG